MLWASFRVLIVFFHYFVRAPRHVFSVLTATVASVYESWVSKVAASLKVEAIITIASDCWIDIRRSGLFSSIGLGVEI